MVSTVGTATRRSWVVDDPALSLTAQAALAGISRSSLYYEPVPPTPDEIAIKHLIDEWYTAMPFLGSRKFTEMLRKRGYPVNRKRIQRYLQEMGLVPIYPGPNLSRRDAKAGIHPYLLRELAITGPNHVWGIDITYIRLTEGWCYLVAVLDLFSRYVVSWELDDTLELPFVLSAVERALSGPVPQIWNSDQGSHFTSPHYQQRLTGAGVQISMDGKGRALDNIFVERLWRTVKYEEVYLKGYADPREARQGLTAYLGFYNERRLHQALGYRTPAAVYYGTEALTEMGARSGLLSTT